jgi:hypothetical protein
MEGIPGRDKLCLLMWDGVTRWVLLSVKISKEEMVVV